MILNIRILLIIFFVLITDLIWVNKVMRSKWNINIENIQGISLKPNIAFAILSYIFLIGGLIYFVQNDLIINKDNYIQKSLINGAIFGLVVYGVYDLTNLSLFKNWNINLAITDIIWGIFLCSIIPLIANHIYYKWFI
jgi:uncharacterized membrane protein